MTDINASYQNADARSVPVFEQLDSYIDSNLTAGAEPAISQPVRILLADSLTLAQFTVVGIDSAGQIVKALYNATPASGVRPVGVLMQAATSGAANSTIYGEVSLSGCFNAGDNDAGRDSPLVWDASWDTLAKKTGGPLIVGNPDLIFRSRLGANAS